MWLPSVDAVQAHPHPAGTSDPSHSNDPSSIEISRWRWSLGWPLPAEKRTWSSLSEMGNDHDTYDTDQVMAAMSRLTFNIFTHHPTIIRAISSEGAGDVDHPSQNGESWNNGYVYTEYRASTMAFFNDYTYGKIWDNEESLDFGVSEFLTIPKPHLWFEVQVAM